MEITVQGTFEQRGLQEPGGISHYQVYLPPGWRADQRWPVALFLHGAGERGDDGEAPTKVGLAAALRHHPQRYPRIIVFPQCSAGSFWTAPAMTERALAVLDAAVQDFHGDPRRVVLTGLSMGGYGALAMAAAQPQRFTAVVAICGGLRSPPRFPIPAAPLVAAAGRDPYMFVARRIAALPIWLFHGAKDPVVPVRESRDMAAALRSVGADVRYSEYRRRGHDAWDQAYAEPALAAWLLQY